MDSKRPRARRHAVMPKGLCAVPALMLPLRGSATSPPQPGPPLPDMAQGLQAPEMLTGFTPFAGRSALQRMLGGAAGVSLCGILLEWRLAVHGDALSNPHPSAARLAAFDEVFLMLACVCMLALFAAWRIRQPPQQLD